MLINSKEAIKFTLHRDGGAIVIARLDIWTAVGSGWKIVESALLQNVAKSPEDYTFQPIQPGTYTAVLVCHVEESINGIFSLKAIINDTLVAEKEGDVDITSQPHDTKVYKNQFLLDVSEG